MAHRFDPTGSALGDMVDAVGRVVAARVLRFGPGPFPRQLVVALTGAALAPGSSTGLAPRPLTTTSKRDAVIVIQRHGQHRQIDRSGIATN